MTRFLHLHTFYPDAITHLYERMPGLKQRSYEDQMEALINDAFSAVHIFTPYLPKLGYQTKFIVANNPFSQERWIREHNIPLRNKHNWVKEIAKAQIESFKPDVLYSCDTLTFDSSFFRSLSHQPKLIMGWRGADVPASIDWSAYDVILSGLPTLLEHAEKLGATKGEFFFPGFPTQIAEQVASVPPRFDVVFTGSWTTRQHFQRNSYLRHIAQQANEPGHNYSVMYYLAGNPADMPADLKAHLGKARFGLSMHKLLRKGRIVFDARSAIHLVDGKKAIDLARDHTINMRIFETLGTGCFLLTEHFEGLKRYFEPGKELETFASKEELVEKIRYYLDHPTEREEIARRGQLRCLSDYSMEKRVVEFDRIIQKNLHAKHESRKVQIIPDTPNQGKPEKAKELLNQSIYAYKNGRFREAYQAATEVKDLRLPILNTDLLRAASLFNLGHPQDALEALSEELVQFPENTSAKQLRAEILKVLETNRQNVSSV